jgi:hypothetical protein
MSVYIGARLNPLHNFSPLPTYLWTLHAERKQKPPIITDLAGLNRQAADVGDDPEHKYRQKNSNDDPDHVSKDTEIAESGLRDFVDDVGDLLTSGLARVGFRPVFDILLGLLARKVPNSVHNIGDAWEGLCMSLPPALYSGHPTSWK